MLKLCTVYDVVTRPILVLKFILVFIFILHSFLPLHPVSCSSDDEGRTS